MTKEEARQKVQEITDICEKSGEWCFVAEALEWLLKDRLDQLSEVLKDKE